MDNFRINTSSNVMDANNFYNITEESLNLPEFCFKNNNAATRATRILVYCVIILISALGNSMTIVVVWRNKTMQKTFHCFIVNLAATDLIITLVYMPRLIVMWLRGSEWLVEGTFGSILCKIVPYLHGVSILVSILTLLAMAVDRFFSVVFPLKRELFSVSEKTSIYAIASIWVLALAVRFPYFLALKLTFHETARGGFTCDANMERAFEYANAREIYYTFLLIAFYALPFVLIIALYTVIVVTLRRLKTPSNNEIAKRNHHKASRKVIYMLITITAAFVLCWLTYFIAQIVFKPVPCVLRFWRLFLAHSNCALNPCLYAVFNEKFRKGYKRLLSSFCC